MTSDARVIELIREHFTREWPRVCPDASFAVTGPPDPPEPPDEVRVHLSINARSGWIILRCWVPGVAQIEGTTALHAAAREVLEHARIPSDDGVIVVGEGRRADVSHDGPGGWLWMSAISFPFRRA